MGESETAGEAAVEAIEETGATGLQLREVPGSGLRHLTGARQSFQISTFSLLSATETRDRNHVVSAGDDDDEGLRSRCESRPVQTAGTGFDVLLPVAAKRFDPVGPGSDNRADPLAPVRRRRRVDTLGR